MIGHNSESVALDFISYYERLYPFLANNLTSLAENNFLFANFAQYAPEMGRANCNKIGAVVAIIPPLCTGRSYSVKTGKFFLIHSGDLLNSELLQK